MLIGVKKLSNWAARTMYMKMNARKKAFPNCPFVCLSSLARPVNS